MRLIVDSVFAAHQLEFNKEMYLDSSFNITIGKEFIDSKLSLETITSSKQVDKKTLRMTVIDLKERLIEGGILSFHSFRQKEYGLVY